MGLDMFAYKVPRKNRIDALHFCKGEEGEIEEIFYWRKHHDLHGWMEYLYQQKGGTECFNLTPVELTLEDLDELEKCIKRRGLPHTEGFFFGNFPPDDESDRTDFEFIKKAREVIKNGDCVYYDSWW